MNHFCCNEKGLPSISKWINFTQNLSKKHETFSENTSDSNIVIYEATCEAADRKAMVAGLKQRLNLPDPKGDLTGDLTSQTTPETKSGRNYRKLVAVKIE